MNLPVIEVIAGAIVGVDGRVLIAQRPPGKHLAGGWEFPGGKLFADEEPEQGLYRELREELSIEVQQAQWLANVAHDYADRRVQLQLWLVSSFKGEPQSLEGQALRWVDTQELLAADMLPADAPLVAALIEKLTQSG